MVGGMCGVCVCHIWCAPGRADSVLSGVLVVLVGVVCGVQCGGVPSDRSAWDHVVHQEREDATRAERAGGMAAGVAAAVAVEDSAEYAALLEAAWSLIGE